MNEEEIEKKKRMLKDFSEKGQGQRVFFEEDLKLIRDILQELDQKESILDKVTDKLKEDAREKEGYIKWLDERTKEIVQPRKTIVIKSDYARSILNIIEGGNNGK